MDPTQITLPLDVLLRLIDTAVRGRGKSNWDVDDMIEPFCKSLVEEGVATQAAVDQALGRLRGIRCEICKYDAVRDSFTQCMVCKRTSHSQCLNATGTCCRRCRDTLAATK